MKRVTLYATFTTAGEPCHNVWDFNRKRLEVLLSDRVANGEAFPGEHIVRCTVQFYNEIRARYGFPPVVQS